MGEGLCRAWGGWGWLGPESADPCHIYIVSVGKDTSYRTPSSSLSLEAMEDLAAVSLPFHTFFIVRISRNFYLYFPGAVFQLLYWPLRENIRGLMNLFPEPYSWFFIKTASWIFFRIAPMCEALISKVPAISHCPRGCYRPLGTQCDMGYIHTPSDILVVLSNLWSAISQIPSFSFPLSNLKLKVYSFWGSRVALVPVFPMR